MASLTSCGHDCGLQLDAYGKAIVIELPFAKTGMECRSMIMNEALGIKAVHAVREGRNCIWPGINACIPLFTK